MSQTSNLKLNLKCISKNSDLRFKEIFKTYLGLKSYCCILKGEGGILLFSYKVVEFFVDIIYESTFGGYEKVLGISKPEKKKI